MNRHERRAGEAAARANRTRANERLRMLVQKAHRVVDDHMARIDGQNPQRAATVSCKSGCEYAANGCCRMIVTTELSEALYIVANNPAAVQRALPRLIEQNRIMVEKLGGANVAKMIESAEEEKRVADEYWDLEMPCAFLDLTTNACTIYEHRPLPCRTYFVTSEPRRCAMPSTTTVEILDKGGTQRGWVGVLGDIVLSDGQYGATIGVALGALPQLVLHALGLGNEVQALDKTKEVRGSLR